MNIEEAIEILKEFKKTGFHTLMIKYNKDRIHTNKIIEQAIETLLTAYEKEKEKNNNVLGLIFEYGQTDGEHHKAWVIDQIVRIITENNYDKWVQHYEYDEETDEDYFWNVGIAP